MHVIASDVAAYVYEAFVIFVPEEEETEAMSVKVRFGFFKEVLEFSKDFTSILYIIVKPDHKAFHIIFFFIFFFLLHWHKNTATVINFICVQLS